MPINPNSLSGSADKLTLAFAPSNSTPTIEGHTDATNQLSAILNGVDDKILHSEPYDVVGGRLDWVSASSIRWSFLNSNQIRLYNPTSAQWELVKCSSEPTLLNTALDMNGTALAPNTIYDVFAEYDSSTAFNLVASRWATGGDGANNSSTSYATPVMTANNAPGPVVVSADSEYDSNHSAYKAFNQAEAQEIDRWLPTNTALPHWLKVDFGQPVCINKYAHREPYNDEGTNYHPKDFTLSGSNDNSNWTVLDTRTDQSRPGAPTVWSSYLTFNNSIAYRYYKFNVTAITGGSNFVTIGELKLVAASNSLSGSSSRVRAYESTVTYNIGDRVTYGGHDWVCIQSGTGQTPAAGAYWVDNGTSVSGDFAGLYRHDGVLVSDSSTTGKSRRWLGIIYTYNNSGTVNFRDDVNYRYVSNWYNRKTKKLESTNSNSNWQYTTATWHEANSGVGQTRGSFILSTSNVLALFEEKTTYGANAASAPLSSVGLNSPSNTPTRCIAALGTLRLSSCVSYCATIPVGYNFITEIECGDGTYANYWYGTPYCGRAYVEVEC